MAGTLISLRAYRLYLAVIGRVRRSRTVYRLLFGTWPPRIDRRHAGYWDWTTLALKRALEAGVLTDARILDLGTGPAAVLAICAKRLDPSTRITACDLISDIVASAARAVSKAGLDVECLQSDLFSKVSGSFDIVMFNAPYLPALHAEGLVRSKLDRMRFYGGDDGGEVLRRFLREVPRHLLPNGRVLLGVNHYHIGKDLTDQIIRQSRLKEVSRIVLKGFSGVAYILRLIETGKEDIL